MESLNDHLKVSIWLNINWASKVNQIIWIFLYKSKYQYFNAHTVSIKILRLIVNKIRYNFNNIKNIMN